MRHTTATELRIHTGLVIIELNVLMKAIVEVDLLEPAEVRVGSPGQVDGRTVLLVLADSVVCVEFCLGEFLLVESFVVLGFSDAHALWTLEFGDAGILVVECPWMLEIGDAGILEAAGR